MKNQAAFTLGSVVSLEYFPVSRLARRPTGRRRKIIQIP